MKIYLASSWRNEMQPRAVGWLVNAGHEVYDFKNPPGRTGFAWREVSEDWQGWTTERYIAGLHHPVSQAGFASDFAAMEWADCGVLLLPCNRSAHLEAGWFAGQGKPLHIFLPGEGHEPELMYLMASSISRSFDELCGNIDLARAPGMVG